MQKKTDVAIIGGGPAGLSAALNASVRNKSILLFSNNFKNSGLFRAEKLDNILGLPGLSGSEYLERCLEQIKKRGIEMTEGRILSILPSGDSFFVSCGPDVYSASTIILASGIATGAIYPGERELLGKGVSYCATCDGMLYRKKKVALVAKSAEAVNEANYLSEIGCDLTVMSDGRDMSGLSDSIPVISAKKLEIKGTDRVEALIADGQELEMQGVFIIRPTVAMQSLFPDAELDEGHIKVDKSMSTSIKGVWAAGDCTGKPYQVSKAVGEGLIAALSAAEYLDNKEKKEKQNATSSD